MSGRSPGKFPVLFSMLVFLFAASVFPAFSQTYGNEWIVPGQTYYKIPVGKTGIYGISIDQLRSAGIPVAPSGSVQPSELQLFHRGVEQAIYINSDSLYFYGQQNDGTLDSLLYEPYSAQPHKYYNLYSDTTAYFLTWGSGTAGKRMQQTPSPSGAVTGAYYFHDQLDVFANTYDMGYKHPIATYMSFGDQGEGWVGPWIHVAAGAAPASTTYAYYLDQPYSSGADGFFEILLVGRTGTPGALIHSIDLIFSNGVGADFTVSADPFAFHDTKKVIVPIPASYLVSNNLKVTVRNNGNASWASGVSVAYARLHTPQYYNMANQQEKFFGIPAGASATAISIPNTPPQAKMFDVTDPDHVKMVPAILDLSGKLTATVPASQKETRIYVVSATKVLPVSGITRSPMVKYSNVNKADYIIITHRKIMEGAREYAAYRASSQGGSYDTLVAEVNNLYDMFSYGERTPVAIRRFMQNLAAAGNPQYLFIIGKGLSLDYWGVESPDFYRRTPSYSINSSDPTYRREDLVPTFGVPGSDLPFSMGLKGKPRFIPAIPTGRLSAKTSQEVLDYLNKIREHEALPNALWRKNLIHLSGGEGESEVTTFRQYVNDFKSIAEDTVFSGKVVKTFTKEEGSTVSPALRSNVVEEVNKGVSYVTFFGHSSPGVSDLDIGFVSADFYGYRNKGKYPMLLIFGCGASQMYIRYSFSEDWILTPDRGAIVTLGHTDAGFVAELYNYAAIFYRDKFQKRSLLGKPVGDVHMAVIGDFYARYGSNENNKEVIGHIHQMVLQGDPATVVYSPKLPDYQTEAAKIAIKSLDGRVVTAVSDSFALSVVVSNPGVDFKDSLKVTVRRTINGKIITYGPVIYPPVGCSDTISFIIRSPDVAMYGENIFEVILDPANEVVESDEMNNTAVFQYFMPLSGVTALWPKEYSIVNKDSVTLIGQSTNLLIGNVDYYFQIDTSYSFNSPYMREEVVSGGSVVRWSNFKLPLAQDSTVYYWRVRYRNINAGEDTLWGQSSFIYIHDSAEGWSQSEFPQFYKDGVQQVQRNVPSAVWEFQQAVTKFYLRGAGSSYVRVPPDALYPSPGFETVLQINGNNYQVRGWCDENALLSMAIDKNTAGPYTAYPSEAGGATCGVPGRSDVNIFSDLSDSTAAAGGWPQTQANLLEYIDKIPDGDYVVFVTSSDARFSNWSSTLKTKFRQAFGAKLLDSLSSGMPYILVAQKGSAIPVYENYGHTSSDIIDYKGTVTGTYNTGSITSTLIGPADTWGTLYRTFTPSEVPGADTYELKIIGTDLEGKISDTLSISQKDSLDLSSVPGLASYAYIRLLAVVTDSSNLTPPQLKKWQVIYTGVPEGTMHPELIGVESYKPVTTMEGDTLRYCYAFENISDYDFKDSLLVKYTVTNTSKSVTTSYVKVKPLKKDSVVTFCYTFTTQGNEGTNLIQAYVNPQVQKEQYYNNNIVETSVTVFKDKINPVLDVVFDGNHIMDGDIVSPSPMITVTVKDENPYQIRTDFNGIEVYLQKPGDNLPQPVSLTSSDIISARQVGSNGKNVYEIQYNPKNLPDGIYTLVVKAKDVAGNTSGVEDFRISFEVINESTITNFYPYPNPFSSNTRFVFTITGSEVPQDLKIQIMTVTGKVVREITKAEIGPIRIGNNKSEFAWDGTDEFGDKLANGVYLYRVVIKNAADFEHRKTAGDNAFKKGYGKLYILR